MPRLRPTAARTSPGGAERPAAASLRRPTGQPPLDRPAGAVFDVDGVVTRTAVVHLAAWRSMFDEFLATRAGQLGGRAGPFTDADYRRFVDGKPRQDGIVDFLASRGLALPLGQVDDPPGRETVWGLGNRKNDAFLAAVARDGVAAYPGTVALLERLRAIGVPAAAVSASRNAGAILESAGVAALFELRVDGIDADRLRLPGKPDPAIFDEATRRLGLEPAAVVLVEDALAGVEAGRRGGYGLVIGVDRTGHADDLAEQGADVVVDDLAAVHVDDDGRWRTGPAAERETGGGT